MTWCQALALLAATAVIVRGVPLLPTRPLVRRLRLLNAEVERVRAAGDPSTGVTVNGTDELARLGATVNELLQALAQSRWELRAGEEHSRREAARAEVLVRTAARLNAELDIEAVLEAMSEETARALGTGASVVYLYDPQQGDLCPAQSHGLTPEYFGQLRTIPRALYDDAVRRMGAFFAFPDLHDALSAPMRLQDDIRALAFATMRRQGQLVGVLCAFTLDAPRHFGIDELILLQGLADQGALALSNARLFTERRQVEASMERQMDQLRMTQSQLIQSARMAAVGELAAGVAHELNNSLTPILGFAQLLLESMPADSPYLPDLERITAKARQASEIVRNLLDFARQVKPHKQLSHLNDVLRNTLVLVRTHLEKKGLVIVEAYGTDLDLLSVDAGQLGQVFLNLINNAAEAMPGGGTLELQSYRRGAELAVAISDTGIGMAPEVQQRIFEPFYTTDSGRAGLGLAVSLGIVQEHGGRITVESQEGQGSTFTVWLPIVGSEEVPGDREAGPDRRR